MKSFVKFFCKLTNKPRSYTCTLRGTCNFEWTTHLISEKHTHTISTYFLFVQNGTGVPELTSGENIKPAPELAKWHMLWKACGIRTWTIKQETKIDQFDVVKNNICRQPQRNAGKRQLLAETNVKVAD